MSLQFIFFPKNGKPPKILIDCGGNSLRRVRSNHLLLKHLWPKLDLLVDINCRMDSTALNADLVLPAAGYYEKTGFKYTLVYVPFLHFGDRAVPPLYEAKDEWDIFKLLAKKVEQRAREKGFTRYTDALGVTRDLGRLYQDFTEEGRFETPEAVHAHVLQNSGPSKGHTLQGMKEKGYALFATTGGAMGTHHSETLLGEDQAIIPCQRHVLAKEPWPTLTGRQQFYMDQDWYLDFGEELPVHKDPPMAGGNYPLRITGGHTRWSIHSIWRDDPTMLRLQRGMPILYMNPQEAKARRILDHDAVRVYNDVNSFRIHAKLSPTILPGQVVVYHAWEPFQYESRRSHQVVMPSPLKPLSLVGGYGHLGYRFVDQQPNQIDRDTVVEVEKA